MYNGVAKFYDRYTADLNHVKVADFVEKCFRKYGNKGISRVRELQNGGAVAQTDNGGINGSDVENSTLVLDCACGTGALTCIMAQRGYDMTGLDISRDMLYSAMESAEILGVDILWLCQDMRKIDMYGSFSAVLCMTDGVNHLITEKQLYEFFDRVYNFIDDGGLLIFDFLTEKYFQKKIGDNVFFEESDEGTCLWTSKYNTKTGVCTYDITVYELCEDGYYERADDRIREKAWSSGKIKEFLENRGFEICAESGRLSLGLKAKADNDSERVYIVARKPKK